MRKGETYGHNPELNSVNPDLNLKYDAEWNGGGYYPRCRAEWEVKPAERGVCSWKEGSPRPLQPVLDQKNLSEKDPRGWNGL